MSRLTRDGTAEPVSRDQILRHARGRGIINFPCSADHDQDWQPYPVDPYSAVCDDHTYIHTYVPENLVSRDGFSRPVPRQPAHLHTHAESGAYLRDSSRVPRRRPFIYIKPPYDMHAYIQFH